MGPIETDGDGRGERVGERLTVLQSPSESERLVN